MPDPQQPEGAADAPSLTLTPLSGELTEPITLAAGEPTCIGRGADADVRLRHESVSKEHARIEFAARTWQLTDLGSLNGTHVSGRRLEAETPAPLKDGDELTIGTTIMRVGIGTAGGRGTTSDPYRTRATIFLRLRAEDDQTRELGWEEFRRRYAPVIVGFARNAGLRMQDADDVLQTVMMNFFRVSSSFEYNPDKGRFRGYLKRATLNVIRKRLRRADRTVEVDSASLADDDHSEQLWEEHWAEQMMVRAVDEARSRFDDRTFEAFDLYARRGVPANAVAERLGMGINSVHQAKSRVMGAITENLARLREAEG